MTVAEFVSMVSIFCIALPQFAIAMTIIFYSETSLSGHLGRSRRCPLNRGFTVIDTIIM